MPIVKAVAFWEEKVIDRACKLCNRGTSTDASLTVNDQLLTVLIQLHELEDCDGIAFVKQHSVVVLLGKLAGIRVVKLKSKHVTPRAFN